MRRTLLLLPLLACTGGDKADGTGLTAAGTPAGTTSSTSTTTPTTGAGTGTGSTATGTGTGTATGTATTAHDGVYTGTVVGTITYQISQMGPVLLIDCTGDATVTVDGLAALPIDGTGTCTNGNDTFNAVITGQIPAPGDAQGQLQFQHASMGFQGPWTGNFTGDELRGSAIGNTGGGYPYTEWTVSFLTTR